MLVKIPSSCPTCSGVSRSKSAARTVSTCPGAARSSTATPSSVRTATLPRLSHWQLSRRTSPSFSSRATAYVSRGRVIFSPSASSVIRSRRSGTSERLARME